MISEKSKTTQRLIAHGSLRFGCKTFASAKLDKFNGQTVLIAYNSLHDTSIDVLNDVGDVLFTVSSQQVAA